MLNIMISLGTTDHSLLCSSAGKVSRVFFVLTQGLHLIPVFFWNWEKQEAVGCRNLL